jgi:AcrR family transcriptional regulator
VRAPETGQVVATRKTPPREHELSRDRVVLAATAVADAEGLSMLSMRRVATDLGVATMSLYRHVPSKDELMLLMTNAVFAEEPFPAQPPTGWRERLEIAARLMWTVFRRHPWAAEIMSMTRPQIMPNLLTYGEWTLTVLHELGLGMDDMMHTYLTLIGHVRGTALNLQPEAQAQQDTGMTSDEWMETLEPNLKDVLASGGFPTFEYVIQHQFDYDLDAVFEYGLQLLLDGIECKLRTVRHQAP